MNATTKSPQPTPASPVRAPARAARGLVLGVDTHQRTHHGALIDTDGSRVGDREFPATGEGYADLIAWARAHTGDEERGEHEALIAAGVESTGSYGAGLTRALLVAGIEVYEVTRPEKSTRVKHGKSDPVDAYCAAEQTRTGRASGRPKITTGAIEALRVIKVPRDGAVKDRTRAYAQLRDLVTTAPDTLRDELLALSGHQRATIALGWRVNPARLAEPAQAARYAIQALARRIRALDAEIAAADKHLDTMTKDLVPSLRAMRQVGPQTAAQLAITAGHNIDRLRSEASFAKLVGVAPLPASSGKTTRHRLNRGGDRHANAALYMIIVGRLTNHPDTKAYMARRTTEGLSKPEIIRCLKRHLARHVYRALRTDLMTT